MLGLGHSLVAGSALDDLYLMTKSFSFDGTDDIFLTNTLGGTDPTNGTAKPVSTSLCAAVWVRLDDDTVNPYNSTGTAVAILNCINNGGWNLSYSQKRFWVKVNFNNLASGTYHECKSTYAKMRVPTSGTDYARYLYKSDHWHLVVFTVDMESNDSSVTTNLYVDGNRAQAGTGSQDGSSGVAQYGSEPETSDNKKTTSASGGDITYKYDATADRNETDIVIGAQPSFASATDVTSFSSNGWTGSIGDIAIWEDVVLTQDDIANLYNLHTPMDMSTIQTSNLRGYWRPTKGNDDSVSGNTGTLVDDTAVVTDSPSLDVSGYAGYR
jgi:hypothetical protein